MATMRTKLNLPLIDAAAHRLIAQSLKGHLNGHEDMERRCVTWMQKNAGIHDALLTASCTDALEMAALLADLQPGDEVIMPSYTFSSTATSVVLRGAVPVFIDIRPDTLNMDEALIEKAITKRTRVICPVHYAGVGCDMNAITKIARKHQLMVVEDAAQCFGATYRGRALGTIGDLGTYSFHSSKVITSGEGGALLINKKKLVKRAEILFEKGTNRMQLLRGEIAKYTWVDIGSSFMMSDISAALLLSQMQASRKIIHGRVEIWNAYQDALAPLEEEGLLRRPIVPAECQHNGHIFYILLRSHAEREDLRAHLRAHDIEASFHYIPLHSSPAGKKYGRTATTMRVTDRVAQTMLRLPVYPQLPAKTFRGIVETIYDFWGY